MRKLYLLAGLPGVGKSTVSRILIDLLDAVSVDIDDFKRRVVDPKAVTQGIDPPETRWLYYELAIQHVLGLYEEGTSVVIMDEVFHLDSLRSQLEAACAKGGVRVVWIEVRCSYETVEKRLRASGRPDHILSTDQALAMHRLFDEIFEPFFGKDNHVVVHNEDDRATIREYLSAALQAV